MKKILMGMIALMLITGNSFAAGDKKAPARKVTKSECKSSDCKDKKDCKGKSACSKACKPSSSCGK